MEDEKIEEEEKVVEPSRTIPIHARSEHPSSSPLCNPQLTSRYMYQESRWRQSHEVGGIFSDKITSLREKNTLYSR